MTTVRDTYRVYTETINEEYYTKKSVVKKCLEFFEKEKLKEYDLIIEPSAGNGAFSKQLEKISKNVLSYDIAPKYDNIKKQDFLELDVKTFREKYKKILTIGNPPFGRQSSLAKAFIKKAKIYSDTIAFILPRSFKKDSQKKVFAPNFVLEKEFELEKKSFLIKGKIEHDVPCIFQIWKLSLIQKPIEIKIEKKGYEFVSKAKLKPDFDDQQIIFIHRAGSKAGLAFIEKTKLITEKNTIKDGYYIIKSDIITNNNKKDIIDKINKIKWEHQNTTGQKSISQTEFIPFLNSIFEK